MAKTAAISIETTGLKELKKAMKAIGDKQSPYLRPVLEDLGGDLASATADRATGGIASASKFVKVRGKGAAISALIHVNHPGAKSAEFGRKFYYRGFTGRDQKATGQRFKPAGGQKAKPFAGIIKGDQAIGSVRNDARQRIGKAIEQEFRRVALGGLN